MKKTIFFAFLLSALFSCSKKQSNLLVQTKSFEIPDSLFALKDITEINDKLLNDSKTKVKFVKLDSIFNHKIIYPILIKNHGFRKDYIDGYETSFFISKQKKIGNFQPIILSTFGVDNWCIMLVVVDSTFRPISHAILKGNYGAALRELNKNLYCEDEYLYSKIDENFITTSKITTYSNSDKEIYKDSINYKSIILKNGFIKTQKIDSIRIFIK